MVMSYEPFFHESPNSHLAASLKPIGFKLENAIIIVAPFVSDVSSKLREDSENLYEILVAYGRFIHKYLYVYIYIPIMDN